MRELANRDEEAFGFVVHFDLAAVPHEWREQWRSRGIAELGQRLDGRGHDLALRVREKFPEKLHATGLRHFGQQVRKLREGGAILGKSLQGTLDPERDFLEPLERNVLELFARDGSRFGALAAEDVDQEVHALRAFELTEKCRDAYEVRRRVVGLAVLERRSGLLFELRQELVTL